MYLAIDANMELAEEEDGFDVFGYLKMLRQSRKGMIESLVSLFNTDVDAICLHLYMPVGTLFLT